MGVIMKAGEHGNVAIRIHDDAVGVKVISSNFCKKTSWTPWRTESSGGEVYSSAHLTVTLFRHQP
jgi:hypothetical protein